MFGVATSLGLGVLQVNAGLAHLFGIPETTPVQILLIAAISLDQGAGGGAIAAAVAENVPMALFTFLEQLPFAEVSSVVATVLVVTFFVTSSDSGSLVIDIITSGGASKTPVWQRTMWALSPASASAQSADAGLSVPSAPEAPPACARPLWPMCATDTFTFDDPVASERCAQDLRRYIDDVERYRVCLMARVEATEEERTLAGRLETCLTDRETTDCADLAGGKGDDRP
jgi:hypothetical protein